MARNIGLFFFERFLMIVEYFTAGCKGLYTAGLNVTYMAHNMSLKVPEYGAYIVPSRYLYE